MKFWLFKEDLIKTWIVYNRPITESGTMGALEFLENNLIQPEGPK